MFHLRRSKFVIGVAAASLAVSAGPLVAAAGSAGAAAPPPAPAWASTATLATNLLDAVGLGPAPANAAVPVTVSLAPRHAAALAALAAAQAEPSSATYHRFLTPAEFTSRFGPTPAQVGAVTAYLRAAGFRDLSVSANRLSVRASGTAASAARAFHTRLGLFRRAGHLVVANTGPALVPASLSGLVDAVIGLNQAAGARPLSSLAGALSPTGYAPPQLAKAYDASTLPAATGTTMAVLAEGNLTQTVKDLRSEEARDGLPQVPVSVVATGAATNDTSGTIEWDLDTQTSAAMAGNVRSLVVYDAPTLNNADVVKEIQAFVTQDTARSASASFGECDTDASSDGSATAVANTLKQAMVQGQTLFASSGDSGSQCSNGFLGLLPGPTETSFPASSTYATGVGGTTLTTSGGAYRSETAWSGSGGGFSTQPAPSYQANADASVAGSGGGGCVLICGLIGNLPLLGTLTRPLLNSLPGLGASAATSGRGVPDIALDADPNTGANIVFNGQVVTVGGTSLSSPLALGGWTRIEGSHGGSLGDASPALYGLYNAANPSGTSGHATPGLHDVTSGTNGSYSAKAGYDLVTGLGSFDVAALSGRL